MLVQALAEYADHYLSEELSDAAWEMKPVPWRLNISRQGRFLNVMPRMKSETRGKKEVQVPMPMSVPRSPVNRNSGEHPLLGTDDIAYVLGVGTWTPDKPADKEKAVRHFEAFVALINMAATETKDAALASCTSFYANEEEIQKAREALREAKAGSLVALAVGEPLSELATVVEYWRKHYSVEYAKRVSGKPKKRSKGEIVAECMISGRIGQIAPTHEPIKGLSNLGGQPKGVALMSFDKPSFQSYGWDKNHNSPVSPDRALAYVLAFNDLLKQDKGRRKDIAGMGFLYWLRDPKDINAFDILDSADPAEVKKLLSYDPRDVDTNRFYMVAVSGNGGRLRVHHWVDMALPAVKKNLRNWHSELRVEYPQYDGEEAPPLRFKQLLDVIYKKKTAEDKRKPDNQIVLALILRGIEGLPLGHPTLAKALQHLRKLPHQDKKQGKDSERQSDPMSLARLRVPVSLIRICVNDLNRRNRKGEQQVSEGLDPSCTIPAYVCGRLMAEFENLQRASNENKNLNSSILDRYFALASTYPSVAFPNLEKLALQHLRKLKRDKPGAARRINTQLEKLHDLLAASPDGAYPKQLGLEGQGLFALGYYHQKAEHARTRAIAAGNKQSNGTAETTEAEINEEETE